MVRGGASGPQHPARGLGPPHPVRLTKPVRAHRFAPPMTVLETNADPILHEEIRALAEARNAVILAHNYERPEIQDVAHYVGD